MAATDPQTAADAAERAQAATDVAAWGLGERRLERIDAVLANSNRHQKHVLKEAAWDLRTGLRRYEAAFAQLTAELEAAQADRARLLAELKQVRVDRRRLGDAYASGWHDAIAAVRMPSTLQREEAWATYRVAREDAWGAETTATRPADGLDGEGAGKGPESP